jgi:integrase
MAVAARQSPWGTANKTAAANKAKEFYLCLQSSGWNEALLKFKPKSRWSNSSITTVGDLLQAVEAVWSGNPKTINDYARAFRKIVADSFQIDGGKSKFDYRSGSRDAWVKKVDRIKLRDVTPDKVQKWKVNFLKRAGSDPIKKRAASISVNSMLRQAKSLFAPAVSRFIKLEIRCSPFEGVWFEPRRSMRYQSSLDVESLIGSAQKELLQEQFQIFLLAIMAGLRRNEIDKLEWQAFDWDKGVISIRATSHFTPKSEDSTGDVELDPEVMEVFRGYAAGRTSDFVIKSNVPVRPQGTYSHYRCQKHFDALGVWLRNHGVDANRPLHTLRKEYGSQVCAKHGIYAASRALRHADIAITSQHYLDKRQRGTAGLGALLVLPRNVVDFQDFEPRILHAEAGIPAPAGDYAEFLGNQIGLQREDVKAVLNPALHGQTRENLVGTKQWEKLENRIKVEELLKRHFPAVWEMIETMQNDHSLLQRRGAQVFFPAYEMALKKENLPAGIPLHDGWVFPAKDEAQLLRVKDVFEQVGSQILHQPMPVKHAIWN